MRENNRDSLPDEFKTIEEAANFWDTHSLADYEDFFHIITRGYSSVYILGSPNYA
jgi:hypothetical protein